MNLIIAFSLNTFLVLTTMVIHYEVLYYLAKQLPRLRHVAPRFRVLIGVCAIFMTHVVEIWIFALGYYATLQIDGMGRLVGEMTSHGPLLDTVYLSFVTFTTVGYGDLVASGYMRYLTGVEALTGLILVTWSASFLFVEMQKFWTTNKE
jgi:Ion channel